VVVAVPGFAKTFADDDLGGGIGQSFYAADTIIRSITVWQSQYQYDWLSGAEVILAGTTDAGVPNGGDILFRGIFVRTKVGDGIPPIPIVLEFDPPWVLPHAGEYAFW